MQLFVIALFLTIWFSLCAYSNASNDVSCDPGRTLPCNSWPVGGGFKLTLQPPYYREGYINGSIVGWTSTFDNGAYSVPNFWNPMSANFTMTIKDVSHKGSVLVECLTICNPQCSSPNCLNRYAYFKSSIIWGNGTVYTLPVTMSSNLASPSSSFWGMYYLTHDHKGLLVPAIWVQWAGVFH